MSYGDPAWQGWVLPEEKALPLLKHAYDNGFNTWDTADVYSNGRSEEIICKALKKYDIPRSKVVILGKCYFGVADPTQPAPAASSVVNDGEWVNQIGLSRKHIFDAVESSCKRLGTYLDVLQIHRRDPDTPAEEIMRALNDVVEKGLVRYIGASSMSAWQFQELQYVADKRNWNKFISMQNYYNLLYREEEREMIPLCKNLGVTCIPWSPIARGLLARPWGEISSREDSDPTTKRLLRARETSIDREIVGRVEEIAKKREVGMACVATAWSLAKGCFPIVGLGSIKRIDEALEAVKFKLTDEEIHYLEEPYQPKALIPV
ncbi:MAG: hypothetical protein M1824_006021 [Vezdaea acicularis]|nr:MAG: hypothetical protein M1824_006021 [Vezdaea acicularis]